MGHGQEMEGCGKCMKYSMFLANFLILIGGIAVLAVGIWTHVDKSFIEELIGTNLYMSPAYILIGSGVVIILISFLGCLGAVKEIKCMLLTFFIIVFLVFVVMLVAGILAYVFRDSVQDTLRSQMKSSIKKYTLDKEKNSATKAWDSVQQTFHCCGLAVKENKGWEIWMEENKQNFNGNVKVPQSCCKKNKDGTYMNCQADPQPSNSYQDDCFEAAKDFVKGHAGIIGGVAIGVACLMILGMVFSFALFKMIE